MRNHRHWYHDETLPTWMIAWLLSVLIWLSQVMPRPTADVFLTPPNPSIVAPATVCPFPPPDSSGGFFYLPRRE